MRNGLLSYRGIGNNVTADPFLSMSAFYQLTPQYLRMKLNMAGVPLNEVARNFMADYPGVSPFTAGTGYEQWRQYILNYVGGGAPESGDIVEGEGEIGTGEETDTSTLTNAEVLALLGAQWRVDEVMRMHYDPQSLYKAWLDSGRLSTFGAFYDQNYSESGPPPATAGMGGLLLIGIAAVVLWPMLRGRRA